MERQPDSRLNATALLSLLVGIFGTVCFFWGIGGIGAIVLGLVAYAEIRRSEGRQHGQGLAVAGIVLGALHLLGLAVGTAALFVFASHPSAVLGGSGKTSKYMPPPSVPTPAPVTPPAATTAEGPGAASREEGTRLTQFGKITLIDPGTETRSLMSVMTEQQEHAAAEHQKLVLWVSAVDCTPCNGVSVALATRRLQEALAGVRLLRVDGADFRPELAKLGIPIDVTPGFAMIGAGPSATDYVNGGEWDADIPENIAPVLGAFVRGTYRTRRNPWSGPRRGDETAL